jgi:hypothetical protein
VLWALLSPSLGSAILPPDTVKAWWHDLVTDDPSPSDRVVDEYVKQVRKAIPWVRSPTIYHPSVDYFRDHFAELDPERPHAFPRVDKYPMVSIFDLATGGPLLVGRQIMVAGNIRGTPTLVTPTKTPFVGSHAVFIRDDSIARAGLFCRVPLKMPIDFADGDRVTVSGVLLADGANERMDGRGTAPISYMACSSIAHSTRRVLRVDPKQRRS